MTQCKQRFLKGQEALPLHERRKLPPDPVALASAKKPSRSSVNAEGTASENMLDALNAAAKAQ